MWTSDNSLQCTITVIVFAAPGETVTAAEEMAARDALQGMFGTRSNAPPLSFGLKGRQLLIDMRSRNPFLDELCGKSNKVTRQVSKVAEDTILSG